MLKFFESNNYNSINREKSIRDIVSLLEEKFTIKEITPSNSNVANHYRIFVSNCIVSALTKGNSNYTNTIPEDTQKHIKDAFDRPEYYANEYELDIHTYIFPVTFRNIPLYLTHRTDFAIQKIELFIDNKTGMFQTNCDLLSKELFLIRGVSDQDINNFAPKYMQYNQIYREVIEKKDVEE